MQIYILYSSPYPYTYIPSVAVVVVVVSKLVPAEEEAPCKSLGVKGNQFPERATLSLFDVCQYLARSGCHTEVLGNAMHNLLRRVVS